MATAPSPGPIGDDRAMLIPSIKSGRGTWPVDATATGPERAPVLPPERWEITMRRLPAGLRVCDTCGQARGKTRRGSVSACLCSGVECLWCGTIVRRPITDYFDVRDGRWWHVSWFNCMTHSCTAPPERRTGDHWRSREPDPDVATQQQATTVIAARLIESRHRPTD